MAKFDKLNAQVLGISVDHVPCLKAWAQSLGGISFPLLSDFSPLGAVAKKYGVKRREGFSERAIFVLDKYGIIRYIDIHNIKDRPKNKILFAELKKVIQLESEREKVAAKGNVKAQPKAKKRNPQVK
jgi:peroxiredoxin